MILQWGGTKKVSTELPVATRHRRDMTEKLLKATLNPNKQQQQQPFCFLRTVRQLNMNRIVTKPTKWHVRPAKTQISLGICPFWSVFTVRLKNARILNYPLSAQQRLIRLGRCPGWSESTLGANAILLVLSRCSSYHSNIMDMSIKPQ